MGSKTTKLLLLDSLLQEMVVSSCTWGVDSGREQLLRAWGRSGYRHCPCSKRLPHWVIGAQQKGSENFQSALGHHCTEQQCCNANADQRFIRCRHFTIPPNSLYQWFWQ